MESKNKSFVDTIKHEQLLYNIVMANGFDMDRKYGIDGQHIQFKPTCTENIEKHDRIWNEEKDITLICVDKDTFVIDGNITRDFLTAFDLVREYRKIK